MAEDLKYFSQRETGAVNTSQAYVCEYFDLSFSDFISSNPLLERLKSSDISRCVGLCCALRWMVYLFA